MEQDKSDSNQPLIHTIKEGGFKQMFTPKIIAIFALVAVLGIVSGYLISGKSANQGGSTASTVSSGSSVTSGTVVGSNDTKTFKDTVEGKLVAGGIDGEGAFHLERVGGESQNVYLTSSIVDLSKYTGKKIKVWGQTQKAQHAGWLMDVGKIEVL